jgi:hypothetical protein
MVVDMVVDSVSMASYRKYEYAANHERTQNHQADR